MEIPKVFLTCYSLFSCSFWMYALFGMGYSPRCSTYWQLFIQASLFLLVMIFVLWYTFCKVISTYRFVDGTPVRYILANVALLAALGITAVFYTYCKMLIEFTPLSQKDCYSAFWSDYLQYILMNLTIAYELVWFFWNFFQAKQSLDPGRRKIAFTLYGTALALGYVAFGTVTILKNSFDKCREPLTIWIVFSALTSIGFIVCIFAPYVFPGGRVRKNAMRCLFFFTLFSLYLFLKGDKWITDATHAEDADKCVPKASYLFLGELLHEVSLIQAVLMGLLEFGTRIH